LVYKNIKFVYDEPALIAKHGNASHLVVADLHIGMELGLSRRGVHLFNATDRMAERISGIMKEFSLKDLIILGDVKESILYPEAAEIRLLKDFFSQLDKFNIIIVAGNHDAHLADVIGRPVEKELVLGGIGFLHGNRKPGDEMMSLDYLINAHDHMAVRIEERNGTFYEQKAWAIYDLNKKAAKSSYAKANEKIKLVSMPAFNDLIMGTTFERSPKSKLNPLLSSNTFNNRSVQVYNLMGQKMRIG
jgi:putative SbcD/Mre11-related phosphoesterase